MPLTRRASTSLAACIRSEGLCDSRQNPYVSQATVFCSHAWAYELDLSLDTLEWSTDLEIVANEGTYGLLRYMFCFWLTA